MTDDTNSNIVPVQPKARVRDASALGARGEAQHGSAAQGFNGAAQVSQGVANRGGHGSLAVSALRVICVGTGLALVAVGVGACAAPTGVPSDAGVTDTSMDADVTSDGSVIPSGCAGPADCDDDIDCTNDICGASGACIHTPVPALCAVGSSCDPVAGCVAGIACASDEDCIDSNACTRNETCNSVSATCTFIILDNDGDGDPPRVCGGTDCDDSNPDVNAAMGELCGNLIDDDCDGIVDTDATMTSQPALRNDEANCGSCGNVCMGATSCYQGSCVPCGGSPGAACCDLECDAAGCDYRGQYCGPQLRCEDDGSDGNCAPCGTIGGPCCHTVNDGGPCGENGRCDHPNDTCIACGAPGQICCALANCSAGATCTSAPSGDLCVSCGGSNAPCCTEGTACLGGVACDAGTCRCGGNLERCCAGNTCSGGRLCEASTEGLGNLCHAPSCGGLGEPCCDFTCFGSGTSCTGTVFIDGVVPQPGSGTCTQSMPDAGVPAP